MNEVETGQRKLERFSWLTDTEETAAYVGGLVGWFGGIVLAISTKQTHDVVTTAGEVFGTAGATALAATGIVAGVRRHLRNRWLSGEKRLYTEEVNTAVDEDFKAGFETLDIWRRRQGEKGEEKGS
ncbi:MAG: hypothetical protein ACREJM_11160 [Candidatus Saccharimonadales bacterium]